MNTHVPAMRKRFLAAIALATTGCPHPGSAPPDATVDASTPVPTRVADAPDADAGLPPEPPCGVCGMSCQPAAAEKGPYPAPFDDCPATSRYGGLFSVITTRSERAHDPGTCCYLYPDQHPHGPGRPYVKDGAAITADEARRDDWTAGTPPDGRRDPSPDRADLVARWTRAALLEHASIAAFAELSLDLLRLGAPPDLLRDTHAAAMDEVEHARLAFGVASAYAGRPIGPGPLVAPPAPRSSAPYEGRIDALARLAVATFHEGAIGETRAALEAHEDAATEADPAVAAVLARIAVDEERHAELAWCTIAWALREGGATVARRLEGALADAEAQAALGSENTRTASARGTLARVLRGIVAPCVGSLLGASASTRRGRGRATIGPWKPTS